jgi:hypothetical protein
MATRFDLVLPAGGQCRAQQLSWAAYFHLHRDAQIVIRAQAHFSLLEAWDMGKSEAVLPPAIYLAALSLSKLLTDVIDQPALPCVHEVFLRRSGASATRKGS